MDAATDRAEALRTYIKSQAVQGSMPWMEEEIRRLKTENFQLKHDRDSAKDEEVRRLRSEIDWLGRELRSLQLAIAEARAALGNPGDRSG